MMNAITLTKDNIYKGNLLLVNAGITLQTTDERGFVPADVRFPNILIKREAANVLQHIFNKIGCANEIVPVSGYRSVNEQIKIYEKSLRDSGEDFTRKFVALPYHSEHHTGLAIDLAIKKDDIDFICPEFPYDGICDDFRKVAPHYGFIERYQSDKEAITGIAHEPWHFRYVGYPHSEIMRKNNFSLEEYIEFIKEFTYGNSALSSNYNGQLIDVFYVPFDGLSPITISIPEQVVYQVSGNNTDGFIITLWRCKNE